MATTAKVAVVKGSAPIKSAEGWKRFQDRTAHGATAVRFGMATRDARKASARATAQRVERSRNA